MAPPIFRLPPEILGHIAAECEDNDLKNLRLTTKAFCSAATKPFGQAFFTHRPRRFVFTEYSLQGLINMTAHPVIGKCFRSISFGTCRLTECITVDSPDEGLHAVVCSHHKRFKEQANLIASDRHVEMVTTALENLEKHNNTTVALGVHDDCWLPLGSNGEVFYRKGYGTDLSYGKAIPWNVQSLGSLQSILAAAANTNFIIRGLRLDITSLSLQACEDEMTHRLVQVPSGALKPDLDLDIKLRYSSWIEPILVPSIRVDSKAGSLELKHQSLYNYTHYPDCHEGLDFLPSAICHTTFRKINLCNVFIDLTSFTALLSDGRLALKSLGFSQCALWDKSDGYDDESIFTFFGFLNDELALEDLFLHNFGTYRNWEAWRGKLGGRCVVGESRAWKGNQEIQNGLDSLVEEIEDFGYLDDWDEEELRED